MIANAGHFVADARIPAGIARVTTALSTELTKANMALALEMLSTAAGRLRKFAASQKPGSDTEPLAPGERSAVQVVAHMLNVEARSAESVYLALLLKEPELPDIHPERDWGKVLRLEDLPFDRLVEYFELRTTMLLQVLDRLTEAQWSRTVREAGKARRESVYWRVRTLVLHTDVHLQELERRIISG
jgi:hypothetical protein